MDQIKKTKLNTIEIIPLIIVFIFIYLLHLTSLFFTQRRVWRYQRGNQNSYIEEEHNGQKKKSVVCSSIYGLWLALWYLLTLLFCEVLSQPLVFLDCILVPSLNYSFWLSIWYIQTFLAWNDIIFREIYNHVLIGALDSLDCIMNSTFHWIVLFNFNKDFM
jgi:hypothetical protein